MKLESFARQRSKSSHQAPEFPEAAENGVDALDDNHNHNLSRNDNYNSNLNSRRSSTRFAAQPKEGQLLAVVKKVGHKEAPPVIS